MIYHTPVLLSEVLTEFNPLPNKIFIDCTVGHGGHTIKLIENRSIVYGIDADIDNLKIATDRINSNNFHGIHGNFKDIKKIWQDKIKVPIDGILVDLGLSNNQQSETGRGFSFNDDQSIDMRLDRVNQDTSAEYIINTYDETQLYLLFSKVAQEKFALPLAQRIIDARQKKSIKSGTQLTSIINDYYQSKHIRSGINPATKIFMALRIEANSEFENLKEFLVDSHSIVKKNGIIGIIAFHSGEDRIVKSYINKNNYKTKRFLPTRAEIKNNKLSRSAILRTYTIN